MFLGHAAVALAAKRSAPKVSLATLLIAAQWSDLLWPVFLLTGVERAEIVPGITAVTPFDFVHYPWSHSLLMTLVWAAGFGSVIAMRSGRKAGVVAAACVSSHWLLDWIAHRPDMPLTPWSAGRYGLGMWNSLPITFAAELGSMALGLAVYLGVTRPRDRIGRWGLAGVVAFLLVSYFGAVFGPPPPNIRVLAVGAILIWALIAVTAWVDRHRAVVSRRR
jgi:membrane-bound metal-dependent hydrolase YbcI (DUF457 family)